MANYENENEQAEPFDGNYGQRFLSANRQAKIVSPMNNVGQRFNYSKARSKFEKRENEKLTSPAKEEEKEQTAEKNESSKSGGSKIRDGLINQAAKRFLPPPLRGLGKSVANDLTSKNSGIIGAITKGNKIKIYLIGGGVVLGLFFVIAIFFAVFGAGGGISSGMNFNDVSDYELENVGDTGETVTETDTTNSQTTDTTSSTKPALE